MSFSLFCPPFWNNSISLSDPNMMIPTIVLLLLTNRTNTLVLQKIIDYCCCLIAFPWNMNRHCTTYTLVVQCQCQCPRPISIICHLPGPPCFSWSLPFMIRYRRILYRALCAVFRVCDGVCGVCFGPIGSVICVGCRHNAFIVSYILLTT